jgi:serine-type D-Ala-D-Ala carboxypeptidase (penicillin-binding protein 5/6)
LRRTPDLFEANKSPVVSRDRFLACVIVLASLLTTVSTPLLAQDETLFEGETMVEPAPGGGGRLPAVAAKSAILVDARTGTVLFEKDAGSRRAPASTTKVMTATLLLEHGGLDRSIVASVKATKTPYANLHLRPGEQIPMRDMLYAILLRSANDGCVAAAETVAGTVPAFVEMMNFKAREIGCTDTHFVTPNGLYDPNHYSTAADLARMAIYASQYQEFNEIVATREKVIRRSISRTDSLMRNHNKLLARYPGCDGIKTGYVRQSGRCLIASATHSDDGQPWRLISVVLNSSNTYQDSAALLNYGFSRFRQVVVARKGEEVASANVKWGKPHQVAAVPAADVVAVVPRDGIHRVERTVSLQSVDAPVQPGRTLGTVTATVDGIPVSAAAAVNGVPVAAVPLVAGEAVGKNWLAVGTRFATPPLAVMLFVGLAPRYARALTKGSRRRRRRVPARRRSAYTGRPRAGRRPAHHHAWDES